MTITDLPVTEANLVVRVEKITPDRAQTWLDTANLKNRKIAIAVIVKAWNAYRLGDQISMLKFRAGGAKPETFPEIV
jgi:hypothetical protein